MGSPALVGAVLVVLTRVSPLPATPAQTDTLEAARRIAATVHLAAQEYALAFVGGRLVQPEEVSEAKAFVAEARRAAPMLPSALEARAVRDLTRLAALIDAGTPPDSVAAHAAAFARWLGGRLDLGRDERPARAPSLDAGARIYASRCAQCHGSGGHGDGPAARGLVPPPADLASPAEMAGATALDVYRRVTYGVPGTAMPAFGAALSRDERWNAVAYVLTLSDSLTRPGVDGAAVVALATVRGTLAGAMRDARRGDAAAAGDGVLEAYLAFEGVEGAVRVGNAGLASRAEARFGALREAAASGDPSLDARDRELVATVDSAEIVLGRSRTGWGYLAESFLLVVREGFEAILIVAAIMAVVLRSGSTTQRRGVRWGVALAILASLATAAGLDWLLAGGAAQRESIEGGVMLVAAGVLFYVSYWLFSKVEAAAWQRFLRDKVERATSSGRSLALASLAFLAVYREGFETVLFYKALFMSGGAAATGPITLGLGAGLAVLVVIYVGIERFGIRIPLRPFFAVTGATLYLMAFVFAGTGIKELQEGALIPSTLVRGAPRSDFFGIYPTLESLAVQGLLVAGVIVAIVWTLARRRAAERERAAAAAAVPTLSRDTRPQETR
jgi:high-affinity iron transporter